MRVTVMVVAPVPVPVSDARQSVQGALVRVTVQDADEELHWQGLVIPPEGPPDAWLGDLWDIPEDARIHLAYADLSVPSVHAFHGVLT